MCACTSLRSGQVTAARSRTHALCYPLTPGPVQHELPIVKGWVKTRRNGGSCSRHACSRAVRAPGRGSSFPRASSRPACMRLRPAGAQCVRRQQARIGDEKTIDRSMDGRAQCIGATPQAGREDLGEPSEKESQRKRTGAHAGCACIATLLSPADLNSPFPLVYALSLFLYRKKKNAPSLDRSNQGNTKQTGK